MELRRAWPWRRIVYIAVLVLFVQAVLLFYWFQAPSHVPIISATDTSEDRHLPPSSHQDHETQDLSAASCLTTFPDLYHEIDRATSFWKSTGHKITKQDVDISWHPTGILEGGAIRFLIHDNKIRMLESINAMVNPTGSIGERAISFLHLLQRALESASAAGETLPSIEASLVLQDISSPPTDEGVRTFWTWTRPLHDIHFDRTTMWEGKPVHYENSFPAERFDRVWLVPNFDFWYTSSVGYYEKAVERAIQRDHVEKIPEIAWRGTQWVNPDVREALVNVTAGKPWADVMFSDTNTHENHIDIADFCKYAMTVHTEGFSYSGRLNYLLNCNSLPFIHNLNWTTHYYHLLQHEGPSQNYVTVKNDFSDLEEKVLHYLAQPPEAQRIISNHIATFRELYLTADAISCYIRKLIHDYAAVAFSPELESINQAGATELRGRKLEDFFAKPEDFKEP